MGRLRRIFPSSVARALPLLLAGAFLLAACTPPAQPANKPAAQATTAPAGQAPAGQPTAAPKPTTAAAPAAPAKTAGPTGQITISQLALLPKADPYGVTANAEHSIVYSIWDPLSRVDEAGNIKMYLAESWQNESPTAWIVKLRKGVKWHDGSPFTAKDVVFSIDRIRDPECKCIWNTAYNYVTGGDIIDDYTVRIKTNSMQVGLPVDFGRVAMIPKDAWEKAGGADGFFAKPVGTGPFKMVKMSPGESWTLEANTDYFLGAPKVKTLIWKQVKDPATRVAELLAGTSDIVIGLPPNELSRIDASPNATTVVGPSVIRVMIDFPLSTTPDLKDKRVREAVVSAINVDAINQATYGGKAGKQAGHFDKHTFGYNKDSKPYVYDVEKAKKLLADAGKTGLAMPLMMPKGGFLLDDEVALAVVDYLNKAGFKIDYQPIDFGTYSAMRLKSEYKGIQLASTRNSTGDPDQIMRSYDPKRQDKYLLDKQLEALIDAQAAEPDKEKRAKAVTALDIYMQENFLAYNMMTVPSLDGISKKVKGFVQSPFETYSFNEVSIDP